MTFGPLGNSSVATPVNWQAEPNSRGTWSIISTCLITLALCLWTALHLNIPEHRHTSSQKWRKLGWLTLGLLAPEMVVYTALEQRRTALRFTKEMQAILGETPELGWWQRWRQKLHASKKEKATQVGGALQVEDATPVRDATNIEDAAKRRDATQLGNATQERDGSVVERGKTGSQVRRHRWTHVHSFYALMGGFAFDTSEAKPNFLPYGRSRLTLRFKALKYIAKRAPSLIPDLAEEDIRDKSKAGGLAKFLVCLQAFWFCLQCIARLAQNQAISFLELNTFGHAICTLLVYLLWWHKPLDIKSPSLLVGEEAWQFCALMCVTSNAETFGNTTVSRLLFGRIFSALHEDRRETELSRGQKYGDRTINRWTDVFNGNHAKRLRQHRFEPRMILRWDPTPQIANTSESNTANTMIAPEGAEVEALDTSAVKVRIQKGNSLFGFRCMDVYRQADWYRAGITSKRPLRSTPEMELTNGPGYYDGRSLERRTIIEDARTCEAGDDSERLCVLDSSDLRRWGLVSNMAKQSVETTRFSG